MYTSYFGLSEIPFSIAPNPNFLFMSDRHREALAHLTYGLGETGGFVLLTGEVGTGKTTISRCLLGQLPENSQAAFILNPTLSCQELLATICDELKVRYRKTGATLKTLTDKIQEKLLKNHQEGLNTILIIDEAQHLKPEVLEQLRLLTNLETDTKKLLQVILIGQPELQQLLQRRDLRQLAQRITARYHLLPLNKQEVSQYIAHRLAIANCSRNLFTAKAINTIHQLSNGIPRLINLLCDRALLGAYGENKQTVDKKLVLGASIEALGSEYHLKPWWQRKSSQLFLLAGVALFTVLVGYLFSLFMGNSPSNNDNNLVQQQRAVPNSSVGQVAKALSKPVVENWSGVQQDNRSLPNAVLHLFDLWRIKLDEEIEQPCQTADFYDLACYWHKGNLTSLLKLGYPAVFKFIDEQGLAFYGTLDGFNLDNSGQTEVTDFSKIEELTFNFNGQIFAIEPSFLAKFWQGGALIFWQAPRSDSNIALDNIDINTDLSAIQWLETKLSEQQQRPQRSVRSLDNQLQNQLQQYQRQHGLVSSAGADQRTLMLLNNTVSQGQPIFNQE
jgi:general secretion pathway protein A